MLKVFRKYNKWIMVVGGSLLMVTFLFTGTANQFQPDPGKRVIATVGDGSIRARDIQLAEAEWSVLTDLGLDAALRINAESGLHWLLLSLEAERAGLVGGPEDGAAYFEEEAGRLAVQIVYQQAQRDGDFTVFTDPVVRQERTNAVIQQLLLIKDRQSGGRGALTPMQIDMALAKLRGVMRMAELYATMPRISEPRAVLAVRQVQDTASAQGFVAPAELYLASAAEPTEAEILAHYEKYREITAGTFTADNLFGFGYVQPPRVKLEWMTLDRNAILDAIRLDPVAVNKFWLQNRAQFPGEFDAEKPRVEAELKREKLVAVYAEADRLVRARVQAATRKLDQDEEYRVLPENWSEERPKFSQIAEELVDSVNAATGVQIPRPGVTTIGEDWVRLDEIGTLPGIGNAQFRAGTVQGPIGELITAERKLNPNRGLIVQAGVPFVMGEITDALGNRYYLTVLDTRPTAPPASLEEVRRQVVTDVKKLKAYDLLVADADRIAQIARTDGLDAAIAALPEATSTPVPTKLTSIRVTGVQVRSAEQALDSESLREKAMNAAYELGYAGQATPENLAMRTVVEPLPRALALGVLQIENLAPITIEQFRQLPPSSMAQLAGIELLGVDIPQEEGVFSLSAVQRRLGYKSRSDEPGDRPEPAAG